MTAADRPLYTATAERDGQWWFLRVREIDQATQARRLDQAEHMVRDLIAVSLDVPSDSFDVFIEPRLEDELQERVEAARKARAAAAVAQELASHQIRLTAHDLAARGLTVRDVGALLGVTHQRVAQLLAEPVQDARRTGVTPESIERGYRAVLDKRGAPKEIEEREQAERSPVG